MCPMEIGVPLKRFVEFLGNAQKLDEEYPCLKQGEWLVSNWAFDDLSASYEPAPMWRPRLTIEPMLSSQYDRDARGREQ